MFKRLLVASFLLLVLVGCSGAVQPFTSPIGPPSGDLPPAGNTELLQSLIMLLVNGGLAGYIVYKLLETPAGTDFRESLVELLSPALGVGDAFISRAISIVATGALSLAGYAIGIALGFLPNPGDLAAWLNLALYLVGGAFPGSQLFHALMKDKQQ